MKTTEYKPTDDVPYGIHKGELSKVNNFSSSRLSFILYMLCRYNLYITESCPLSCQNAPYVANNCRKFGTSSGKLRGMALQCTVSEIFPGILSQTNYDQQTEQLFLQNEIYESYSRIFANFCDGCIQGTQSERKILCFSNRNRNSGKFDRNSFFRHFLLDYFERNRNQFFEKNSTVF